MTDAIKVTYFISSSVTPQCQRKVCISHIGFFVLVFFNVSFNYDVRGFHCMQEVTVEQQQQTAKKAI